jgi:YVTN family beta-propeller protein
MRNVRIAALAALAVTLGSGCSHKQGAAEHASSDDLSGGAPLSSPTALIYVSNEAGGSVAVVDPKAAQVVATIEVGKRPRGIQLSRDRKLLYVTLTGSPSVAPGKADSPPPAADRSADGVAVVDLATRKVARVLPSGPDPETFDVSPDGSTLFVSNEETSELSALDLSSGTVRAKASVGKEPGGVAVRPDGKVVYVTSKADATVSVVDTSTLSILAQIPAGKGPRSVVFAKDGGTAFVTNELGASVTVIDTGAQKSKTEIAIHEDSPMPSGVRPMGAALSPDGKWLYVSTGRGGSLAIIDVAQLKQVRSIDGIGDRPWGIALSPDGKLLYSANGTSTDLSIVNLATGNVDKRVHIGGLPWGLVVAL